MDATGNEYLPGFREGPILSRSGKKNKTHTLAAGASLRALLSVFGRERGTYGIIQRIVQGEDAPQNSTSAAPTAFPWAAPSGKRVNERSSMQMTAVYSCVRILSEAVAGLPLHFTAIRITAGRKRRRPPAVFLLHDEPNPEMTSFVFRETLMTHLLPWGNAYAQIIRNGKGGGASLYPLMPDRMNVDRDQQGQLYYEYTVSMDDAPTVKGRRSSCRPRRCCISPALALTGWWAIPHRHGKERHRHGDACEEYGATFFANGAQPSGVLEHPGTLKDPTRVRESWQSTFGGSHKCRQGGRFRGGA